MPGQMLVSRRHSQILVSENVGYEAARPAHPRGHRRPSPNSKAVLTAERIGEPMRRGPLRASGYTACDYRRDAYRLVGAL